MADISITTKKKCFFYFLRFVIYLTCFGAFSQQIVNIFEGHFQNLTAIASGLKIVKEINLPALTICPGVKEVFIRQLLAVGCTHLALSYSSS